MRREESAEKVYYLSQIEPQEIVILKKKIVFFKVQGRMINFQSENNYTKTRHATNSEVNKIYTEPQSGLPLLFFSLFFPRFFFRPAIGISAFHI